MGKQRTVFASSLVGQLILVQESIRRRVWPQTGRLPTCYRPFRVAIRQRPLPPPAIDECGVHRLGVERHPAVSCALPSTLLHHCYSLIKDWCGVVPASDLGTSSLGSLSDELTGLWNAPTHERIALAISKPRPAEYPVLLGFYRALTCQHEKFLVNWPHPLRRHVSHTSSTGVRSSR